MKRHEGWKSAAVAEGYIEESIKNNAKIGGIITSAIITTTTSSTCENSNHSIKPPLKKLKLDDIADQSETSVNHSLSENKFFNFMNCSNITIHYKGP